MSKDLDNKYFIIINKDKIIFSCLNNENKISFTKSHTLINGLNNLLGDLEKFFNDKLIDIEKNLKDFIKKIYVIIDRDNSLSVNLAIKYNFKNEAISEKKINDLISSLKYQFTKYTYDQKIIHIFISKILIDDKENDLSSLIGPFNDFILEVKFECLKLELVNNIKKLFSKYQISVEKILIANHLRHSIQNYSENIVYKANKVINGENLSEVRWIEKKIVEKDFFEKFFNFFK